MLTRGNLVFAANYRRAADSRPYGRFPAVCKKDSGIDWWSNKSIFTCIMQEEYEYKPNGQKRENGRQAYHNG